MIRLTLTLIILSALFSTISGQQEKLVMYDKSVQRKDFEMDTPGIDSVLLNKILQKEKICDINERFFQIPLQHYLNADSLVLISLDYKGSLFEAPDIYYRLLFRQSYLNKFYLVNKIQLTKSHLNQYSAPPYYHYAEIYHQQTGCPKKCIRIFSPGEIIFQIVNSQYIEFEITEPEKSKVRRKVIYSELKTKRKLRHIDSFAINDIGPIEIPFFRMYCNCMKK